MSGNAQINLYHTFEIEICCSCDVTFAVPRATSTRWQQTGETFCCPYGHKQHYGSNENSELKEKLKQAKKKIEFYSDSLDEVNIENGHLRHTVRAEKGAKTKLKKRIANGVCPCCKRSFTNVKRHMDTQHPEYGKGK